MRLSAVFYFTLLCGCQSLSPEQPKQILETAQVPTLNLAEAERLAALPMHCIQQEFPYKLGQTLGGANDLRTPKSLHPSFYGCFDWHSAVHGHWSLVALLKEFPNLKNAPTIKDKLLANISGENILGEVAYFQNKHNRNFERTYGWAWLLKLALEIESWDDPMAEQLSKNLQPLANLIVEKYVTFLPKLLYPIRSGTHPNTAFGLSFAYEYAKAMGIDSLTDMIRSSCLTYYQEDRNCPLSWEPSGADFLSPCLEEVDMMRRILSKEAFKDWLVGFLPDMFNSDFTLQPGLVADREDGQLVHLDGVNFSRAWCLYALANDFPELDHLRNLGDLHVNQSLPNITDGNYEGGHWLASFAILAIRSRKSHVWKGRPVSK